MPETAPAVAAIVLAGGSGTRLALADGRNKVHLALGGRPLLAWSLRTLDRDPRLTALVLVVRGGDEEATAAAVAAADLRDAPTIVAGGDTRTASEVNGVTALRERVGDEPSVVLVHDGARPFVSRRLLDDLVAGAWSHGVAVPGLPLDADVVAIDAGGGTGPAPPRLRRVQTPQAVRADVLWPAYAAAAERHLVALDTAELVTAAGGPPATVVPGDVDNIKVTLPADLPAAARIAARWTDEPAPPPPFSGPARS